MPTVGPLKSNHKAFIAYHDALKTYAGQKVEHEGALETAFSRLFAIAGSAASRGGAWQIANGLAESRSQVPTWKRTVLRSSASRLFSDAKQSFATQHSQAGACQREICAMIPVRAH